MTPPETTKRAARTLVIHYTEAGTHMQASLDHTLVAVVQALAGVEHVEFLYGDGS